MLDIAPFPADRAAKRDALLAAVESVRDVVEAMQDAGLFRLKLPAELGGAEADPVTQIDVIEAMTRIYPSAGWLCSFKKASSSSRQGRDGCAPDRVTESAPAALPHAAASWVERPSARATAKAPTKASPAATVSTTGTWKPDTR